LVAPVVASDRVCASLGLSPRLILTGWR
jgi:hypothetical protein